MRTFKKLLLISLFLAVASGLFTAYIFWDVIARSRVLTLDSCIMPEARTVVVYLPASYDANTTQRYDVLYTLDGERIRNSSLAAATARIMSIPDIIVVAVDAHGKRMRDFGLDSAEGYGGRKTAGQAIRFLSFLEKELLPHINQRFRTSGKSMLAGHSMGGLVTTYAFMTKPHVFEGYFAFSPTFPAALGAAEAFEETLYDTEIMDKFLYLNLGLESGGGYRILFKQVESALRDESPSMLHSTVSYYPLPHSLIMVPGYFEALSSYYESEKTQ